MSEQAEQEPQFENRKTSEPSSITEAAGALPSNLQELKEALSITKMMRQGAAAASGIEDLISGLEKSQKSGGSSENNSKQQHKNGESSSKENQQYKPGDWQKVPSSSAEDSSKSAQIEKGDSIKQQIDRIGDGHNGIHDIMRYKTEEIPSDKQGTMKLATGDTFIRVSGAEILVAPGGDTLVVNKDGSFDVGATKGVSIKHDAKSDSTTLTYPNGDTVRISGGRITDVERKGASVHMNSAREDRFPRRWPEPWDKVYPQLPNSEKYENKSTPRKEYPNSIPNSEKYENKSTPRKEYPNSIPNSEKYENKSKSGK